MKPKKIWANLGVIDVERTRRFYDTIGIKRNSGHDGGTELASFLFGDDNFVIHFFRKDALEKFLQEDLADLKHGSEIIFTLSAESKEEVNAWAEEVRNAGGTIVTEPAEFGEGFYGFTFSDPDGHKYNVFFM